MAALLFASVFSLQPARAQSEELEKVERSLQRDEAQADALAAKSKKLAEDIQRLRHDFAGLRKRLNGHHRAIESAQESLAQLTAKRSAAMSELEARREEFHGTLSALERIALRPRAALLASPQPPVDTLRGALLLGSALPRIEARARRVEAFIRELQELTTSIEAERQSIEATKVSLERDRGEMDDLISRKSDLLRVTLRDREAAETRAAALAEKADNLRHLMTLAVEAAAEEARSASNDAPNDNSGQASDSENTAQAEERRGVNLASILTPPAAIRRIENEGRFLLLPVDGRIIIRYGQRLKSGANAGESSKGLVITSPKAATVVAPYDGRVVYAGEFRSYGQILIIDHGGRYHSLLAGLHRISATAGQWVLAGEPIAVMNPRDGQQPELYLELRKTGEAIDPLPWLAEVDSKVRG